ncbi:UDP-N-acetylmuramate--L-alanine ligase [Psychromicrobium xiongbiense]|uniref:UDP-N-acetylmuramate--L-alanine ligase n=1 Tax=Psychromicrobium xiongbiense TaxID=3051184 RepID=UPI003B227BA6
MTPPAASALNPALAGRTIHFIGVGGAGMSAIARIMLQLGVAVSGSDGQDSPVLAQLRAQGAQIHLGHDAAHLGAADTVVYSSAIRADNAEFAQAQRAGLRIWHRSEALAAVMSGTVIAVAGTHGKTTTTSMTVVALRGGALDPGFAIGAVVAELGSNAALGSSPIFVAEADESDGSFLNYRPQIAVVTNIEADHLDHYGTAEAVNRAFEDFAALLPAGGLLVACADDAGASALADRTVPRARVVRYGRSEAAQWRISGGISGEAGGAVLTTPTGEQLVLNLAVPGEHNVLNAVAAVAVASELGVEPAAALAALAGFRGAARRFEAKGEARGVRVFDDYAHHPTEVRAALQGARAVAGEGKVRVLFQPHLFSRTQAFAADFAHALRGADEAYVLDIYAAREDPVPGVDSRIITEAAALAVSAEDAGAGRGTLHYAPDAAAAVGALAASSAAGDVLLTIGAGDVTRWGSVLLTELEASDAT